MGCKNRTGGGVDSMIFTSEHTRERRSLNNDNSEQIQCAIKGIHVERMDGLFELVRKSAEEKK